MNLSIKSIKYYSGFSLVEVIVAVFLLALGISATFGLFGFVIKLIGKTESLAKANAAIDSDIAIIKQKSEEYTSCISPRGSFSGTCDQALGNTYYYFPNPSLHSDGSLFYDACRTTTQASHLTQNFITGLNGISETSLQAAGVDRLPVERVNPTVPTDHSVKISYTGINVAVNRTIKISPVVSSWCP